MRTSFAFLLCGATIFLTACDVEGPAPDEHITTQASAIKGGYTDTSDTAVVGVVLLEGQGIATCTGSLLLPNMVLTARHCVSDTLNDNTGVNCSVTSSAAPQPVGNFYVTTKGSMTQNPADYHTVKEVLIVPAENNLFCGNDQAILILNDLVPESEAIPMVPRVDTVLAKGEGYSAIGFGETNDGANNSGTRRRLDNLFVDCAEDGCKGLTAFVKVTEWVGDHGICSGDSGGPAMDLQNRVVGVTSRGGAGCTSPVYGAIHGWGQWIMDSAVHAAEVGGYEPPPWATGYPTDPVYNYPVGGACDESCASNLCLADECTKMCNETAYCPDNYDCVPIDDTSSACQKHVDPPKKKKQQTTVTSCSMSAGDRDPTNPVPWFGAIAVALGAAVARKVSRRSKR